MNNGSDFNDDDLVFFDAIPVSNDILTDYIDSSLIYKHAELFKYSIYKLICKVDNNDYKYCVLKQDYSNYWCVKGNIEYYNIYDANNYGNDTCHTYIELTDYVFDTLKAMIPTKTQINVYFTQRLFWSDDMEIRNRPAKKIEFETVYKLFLGLAHRMIIKHQVNFMNYYVDMLLEVKDNIDYKTPRIGIEIDENDHCDRNPEEIARQNVLEYFDNIIYRIPIMKTDTDEQITIKVNDIIDKVTKRANDLLMIYNPNLSREELEQELISKNFASHVIEKFLDKHNTGDDVYCLRHDIVAKYLDYGKTDNYRKFRQLFTYSNTYFKENIDYKIVRKNTIENLHRLCNKTGTKLERIEIIIFSRSTFHKICILSKKPKAYEIAMSFCNIYNMYSNVFVKSEGIVKQNRRNVVLEEDIKKRVEVLVKQRIDKTRNRKLENKLENVESKYNKMVINNDNLQVSITELTTQVNSLYMKCQDMHMLYKTENYNHKELKIKYSQLKSNNKALHKKYKNVSNIVQETHTNPQDENIENNIIINNLTTEQTEIIKNFKITKLKLLGKSANVSGYNKYRVNTKNELANKIISVCIDKISIATIIINLL
jgi:hypothetical protein